jgi:hypothetical protein
MGWDAPAKKKVPSAMGDEVAAAEELARLAARMRARVAVPLVFAGALLGAAACGFLFYLWAEQGVPMPKLAIAVAFLVPFAGCGWIARLVARAVVRRRGQVWADDIARRYGVNRASLRDIVQYWD